MTDKLVWKSVAAAVGLCASISAGALTIDAKDRGWYTSDSATVFQDPASTNYVTGDVFSNVEFRSFFVFDLGSISGTVTAATLRILNPGFDPSDPNSLGDGFNSPDASENLNMYHVGTSSTSLVAGTAGAAGFADLGDGAVYGSHLASATDNGAYVTITLNGAAISAIAAALGGDFTVGGALSTLSVPGVSEFFFGFSGVDPPDMSQTQLILEGDLTAGVPEPGSLALFGFGMFALGELRRRRRA